MTDKEKVIELLNYLNVKYHEDYGNIIIDDAHSHEEVAFEFKADNSFDGITAY